MLSRGIIGAAFAVYLIVLGCVMMPSEAPAKKMSASGTPDASAEPAEVHLAPNPKFAGVLPFKGAAMQIQRVDWIDKYKQGIDEIAALGLDTVSLVIDTRNGRLDEAYAETHTEVTPGDYVVVEVSDSGCGMPPGVRRSARTPAPVSPWDLRSPAR